MMIVRRNRKSSLMIMFLVTVLILSMLPGCSSTGTAADNSSSSNSSDSAKKVDFPTKDITFIVPVSPGGGFDTYSRLLVQYMPKYLPKEVNMIVKNVPGGEWKIGIGEIVRAKPDGYTIGIFNIPGNVVNQILGSKYDLNEMTWLGRITDITYIGALSPKSKYKSIEDLKNAKEEVKVGVVGLSSTAGLGSLLAFEEMGIKAKYVTHEGSSEAIMAAIRGDVDYVQYPYPSLKKFIVDSQQLKPIVVFGPDRYKDLPDVPTIKEIGYESLIDIVKMDYLVGGTPGISAEVADILKDAFQKAVKDPEFVQKMVEIGQDPNPASAEEAAKIIKQSLNSYAKYKELVIQNRK